MELKLTLRDLRRFWAKVRFDGESNCWEWLGSRTSDKGNGRQGPSFHLGNQKLSARRLSYFIHFGQQPAGNVGCSCSNPLCVNPQHLLPLPQANEQVRAYRTANKRKLDDNLVRHVLAMRRAGKTQPEISRATGLNQSVICLVLKMARYCKEGRLGPFRKTART